MPRYTRDPVCSRFILHDDEKPLGHASLFKDLWSVRRRGFIEAQGQAHTEEERSRVLEEKVGVVLTKGEKKAIRQKSYALPFD